MCISLKAMPQWAGSANRVSRQLHPHSPTPFSPQRENASGNCRFAIRPRRRLEALWVRALDRYFRARVNTSPEFEALYNRISDGRILRRIADERGAVWLAESSVIRQVH